MSNPTHEEAKWLIAHAKENNKVEWLAGWDSGRNYGKLCAEERIIKLLEEHIPIEDNYNIESSCRGCDWYWAWNSEVNDSHENHLIALIKGEK